MQLEKLEIEIVAGSRCNPFLSRSTEQNWNQLRRNRNVKWNINLYSQNLKFFESVASGITEGDTLKWSTFLHYCFNFHFTPQIDGKGNCLAYSNLFPLFRPNSVHTFCPTPFPMNNELISHKSPALTALLIVHTFCWCCFTSCSNSHLTTNKM